MYFNLFYAKEFSICVNTFLLDLELENWRHAPIYSTYFALIKRMVWIIMAPFREMEKSLLKHDKSTLVNTPFYKRLVNESFASGQRALGSLEVIFPPQDGE